MLLKARSALGGGGGAAAAAPPPLEPRAPLLRCSCDAIGLRCCARATQH
jgi:hypothetical protein